MSVEVVLDSPLAHSLNSAIQPKLVEVGWSSGVDDSALSEYIILMLVNGKTQDQIAAELSGDLLNLGPDDPGARDFAQWLFRQVDVLNSEQTGTDGESSAFDFIGAQEQTGSGGQDAEMGDVPEHGEASVPPTGPKSMRNGAANRPRDRRMLGHLTRAMDRTHESVLHRVRPQNGSERINSHSRGPPTGPRQQAFGRGTRPHGTTGGMQAQGTAASNVMNMTPQQQMELYAMLEQQSRLMAQMLGPHQQQTGNSGSMSVLLPPQQNKGSLFDRVQANPQRPQIHASKKDVHNGKARDYSQKARIVDPSALIDVEMSHESSKVTSPETICPFRLYCKKPDCPMAHQSPAAPPGTTIDVSDVCSFGVACKNHKCTGRHPSPAQKLAHQTEVDCKYFPNCTKGNDCPFRHPSMPLCRNGADCTAPNCKFTHTKVMCKHNPCERPACPFKHSEGQKRGKFSDKVWVADGAKEHVSERKFVNEEGVEELIRPGAPEAGLSQDPSNQTEIIT